MVRWKCVPLVDGYSLPEKVIEKLKTYDMYLHDGTHIIHVNKDTWPDLWKWCIEEASMEEHIKNHSITIVIYG